MGGGVLGVAHVECDPLLLPAPAVPGSFRDADALAVASPLCSDPVETFLEAVTLRLGREIVFRELTVDGDWTKTNLFCVDSGKSQLLLTPELFPWDPASGQDGEGQLGSGGGISLGW